MTNPTLPEVTAARVVIPGPDGRPRIEIGLVDGEPAIRFFDSHGKERIRLGFDHDVDEKPEYSGLVAELRLTAADDGGEVSLTAAYGAYAAIEMRSRGLEAGRRIVGALVEAKEGRVEASLHDQAGVMDLGRGEDQLHLRCRR